ncbi:DUF6522 family protein [uncultured Paracoccus sp.]|uniref:DUF6522 family protein n=1 Tax=uncultured Paracoccus sp. TaxID=189685 RepID=UPI00261D8ACC|nr:DUF6522 family protein [uncultured Paracoccus sp.]
MKVERRADGRIIVEAAELAPLLGLDLAEFQSQMRSGQIATGTEEGQGEDAGRFRVTFTSSQWKLRLTCAADGTVISRIRTEIASPRLS